MRLGREAARGAADNLAGANQIADPRGEIVNLAAHDRAHAPRLILADGQLAGCGHALGDLFRRDGGDGDMGLLLRRLVYGDGASVLFLLGLLCRLGARWRIVPPSAVSPSPPEYCRLRRLRRE